MYPTMQDAGNWGESGREHPWHVHGNAGDLFRQAHRQHACVRVVDPKRRREMLVFGGMLSVLFLVVMVYLLQHLSAIEYGYRIEQAKAEQQCHRAEQPRAETGSVFAERLWSASRLRPSKLGMIPPVAGQVQSIESGNGDTAVPVMAKANPSGILVVSVQQ